MIVDYDVLPAIIHAPDGMKEDAPLLFPDTGSNICFASQFPEGGTDEDPCEGAAAIGEVDDGQPAARRCADGEQRCRRRARR